MHCRARLAKASHSINGCALRSRRGCDWSALQKNFSRSVQLVPLVKNYVGLWSMHLIARLILATNFKQRAFA